MMRWRTAMVAIFLALLSFVLLPCRRGAQVKGLTLTLSFAARPLTDDLYTDLTFRFKTGASFVSPSGGNQVIAEFSTRERQLIRVSFLPTPAPAAWTADKEYVFTWRVYIPAFIDTFSPTFRGSEFLSVTAGLAGAGEEHVPQGSTLVRRRLRVLVSPDSPVIVFANGWYPPEPGPGYTLRLEPSTSVPATGPTALLATSPASSGEMASPADPLPAAERNSGPARDSGISTARTPAPPSIQSPESGSGSGLETVFAPAAWRWTGREATCFIDNPGRSALLAVRGSIEPAYAPGQTISIRLAGVLLDEFTPPGRDFERAYMIGKDRLKGRRDFALTLAASKTYVPAHAIQGSTDTRELGIRVAVVYFR